ncbi:MAG: hypothetical protein FWD85_03140 [Microbacteriaceae bacterium]|nr:hypothetical protein [Microbacteriaceae bacterium]MCL2794285.1 hypothetical protein [Microbacteriaceae bacterium]
MIAARRVGAHSALFAALACVAALLAGLAVGLVGHLDSAALDGVRGGIAALGGSHAELSFDAPKASGDTAQRTQIARTEAILRRELPPHVHVTRADDAGGDVVWTVRADAAHITPADLPVLARAGSRIHDAMLNDQKVAPQGVEKSGSLDAEARALAARVAPLAGIQPVPLLLVAAIGLVTLAELARLLDGVRLRETALLRSRGASAARIGLTTTLEAFVVAGLGALAGAAAATGLLRAFGEHPLGWPLLGSITGAVVAAAIGLVGGVAYNSARLAFRRDTADDSGRARRLAAPGLVVLLVAAAGLSLWRWLEYGSPLSPTAAGARVDPIAVLAPALCLAAIAVLCLAVFPVVVRWVESAATRGDGIRALLVAGQLARRARMIASPLVLIALAGGGLVLAACYAPTWQAAAARTAAVHAGADLVVTGTGADSASIAKLPGVRAAAPVTQLSWTDDNGVPYQLTAIGQAGVRSAVSPAGGAVDPAALATRLHTALAGAAIPDGATTLDLSVAAHGFTPTMQLGFIDENGATAQQTATADAAGRAHLALSPGPGRRLVSVTVDLPSYTEVHPDTQLFAMSPEMLGSLQVSFRLTAVTTGGTASGAVDLGRPWRAADRNGNSSASPLGTVGFSGMLGFARDAVELTPSAKQDVPLVISSGFAAAAHARVGTPLALDAGSGVHVNGTVAAVQAAIPGVQGANAALADAAALQTQLLLAGDGVLPSTGVWVSADASADVAATAAAIARAEPGASVTGPAIAPGGHVLDAVPVALWLGMGGGALLALIALAAVAGELLRLRAEEVGVLRALGFAPRMLARLRRAELAAAVAAALLGAAIAGTVVSALVVPGLTRVAIENPIDGLALPLHVDPVGLGIADAALLAAAAAVIAVYGARVAQQARTIVTREAAR